MESEQEIIEIDSKKKLKSRIISYLSDSNKVAAFASIVAAFAAILALFISFWQSSQLDKTLQITLSETRPILILEIEVEPLTENLSRVKFVVKNSGPIPARILHSATQPWVDNDTRNPTDHTDIDIVSPGETHIISSFDIKNPLLKNIINDKSDLKYAIALLYSTTTKTDTRKWITDVWVAYSLRKKAFAVRKRDEIEVNSKTKKCNLNELKPQNWLEWQPPK
ncbi:hypothetical protein [Thalassobellus sediminis]|uniref:hypothetical protein n=1 Tax=Thalassobellus sediminis TaxID=3367753 RepID=UPI00379601EB